MTSCVCECTHVHVLTHLRARKVECHFVERKVKVTQLCPTLCDPMNCIHEILQARILEWVAFPFSRGSSQPRDQTQVSHLAGGFFTSWATREAPRLLEWVAYPFSSRSSWPRNRTRVSCIAGGFFTNWAMREALVERKRILNFHLQNSSFLAEITSVVNIIEWECLREIQEGSLKAP